MIHTVAICPYCASPVSVDGYEIVFDVETQTQQPCEHVVWVELYPTRWVLYPDGSTRPHEGSADWRHPLWSTIECEADYSEYMCDFLYESVADEFVPAVQHEVITPEVEETTVDPEAIGHLKEAITELEEECPGVDKPSEVKQQLRSMREALKQMRADGGEKYESYTASGWVLFAQDSEAFIEQAVRHAPHYECKGLLHPPGALAQTAHQEPDHAKVHPDGAP